MMESIDKKEFLKNFIIELGRASLSSKHQVKVPIQSVNREPIEQKNFGFEQALPKFDLHVKPIEKKKYFEKTMPPLFKKEEPVRKDFPVLSKKPGFGSYVGELTETEKKRDLILNQAKNVNERKPVNIDEKVLKEYGPLGQFVSNPNIVKISCIDLNVFVDYKDNRNVSTGVKFKDEKEANKVIKFLGSRGGMKVSKEDPIVDVRVPEGFRVHGNLGSKFTPASFVMVRENFY